MAGACLGFDGKSLSSLFGDTGAESRGRDGVVAKYVYAEIQCEASGVGSALWGPLQGDLGGGEAGALLRNDAGLYPLESGEGGVGGSEGGTKYFGISLEQPGRRVCGGTEQEGKMAGLRRGAACSGAAGYDGRAAKDGGKIGSAGGGGGSQSMWGSSSCGRSGCEMQPFAKGMVLGEPSVFRKNAEIGGEGDQKATFAGLSFSKRAKGAQRK